MAYGRYIRNGGYYIRMMMTIFLSVLSEFGSVGKRREG